MGDEVFEMIVMRAPGALPPGDEVAIERFQDLLTEAWEAGDVHRFYSYSGDHHLYLLQLFKAMGVSADPMGHYGETSDFIDMPHDRLPGVLADLDTFVRAMEDDPSPLVPLMEADRERSKAGMATVLGDVPPSKRPGYPGHSWMSDAEVDANWHAMQPHRAKAMERMETGRALNVDELRRLWAEAAPGGDGMRDVPPEIQALFDAIGPTNQGIALLRSFDYILTMRGHVATAIEAGQSILCVDY